jgi:hypothetical protein
VAVAVDVKVVGVIGSRKVSNLSYNAADDSDTGDDEDDDNDDGMMLMSIESPQRMIAQKN